MKTTSIAAVPRFCSRCGGVLGPDYRCVRCGGDWRRDDLREAATNTIQAIDAIFIADFDADDSGAIQHVVETEDA